jgi:hypothetical protein
MKNALNGPSWMDGSITSRCSGSKTGKGRAPDLDALVRDWLLPALESRGISCWIDYRDFEIGLPSILNMERAIEKCGKTALALTPNWVQSEFASFESMLLQSDDPLNLNKRILPLLLEPCELPRRIRLYTYADLTDKSDRPMAIGRVVERIISDCGKGEPTRFAYPVLSETDVDTCRLPQTGYELFGRQAELQLLNDAWETNKTNVVVFVAGGGVGKSTLVNKWIERMRWDNFRGACRVYGWSFYSQGAEDKVASADLFIRTALEWFGDEHPDQGSPWAKGERLADLVAREKTLLILDGLEPVQFSGEIERGRLRDPALAALLAALADDNSGLCVITTREKVSDIADIHYAVVQRDLEELDLESGRMVLRMGGVRGTDHELEDAARSFGNHALTLRLLAQYLRGVPEHHVSILVKEIKLRI